VKPCFKVEESPETVFQSEITAPVRVAPRPIGQSEDLGAVNNIVPNVHAGGNVAEQIAELCANGIEVDDDNKPLDEGAEPARKYTNPHNFTVPTHCPRRERNATDARGSWEGRQWDQISEYTELELFCLCFPEGVCREGDASDDERIVEEAMHPR
jgi:hypothetical protein